MFSKIARVVPHALVVGDCEDESEDSSKEEWRKNLDSVRICVKQNGCTIDPADIVGVKPVTAFGKRVRRLHIHAYCHRIFARHDEDFYDAPCLQPQYIGVNEGEHYYRLKGFYLPVDEDGYEYYLNRRLEDAFPDVYGSTAMWKSPATEDSSPVRKSSRSKFGMAINVSLPSSSSSSTDFAAAAQLALGN